MSRAVEDTVNSLHPKGNLGQSPFTHDAHAGNTGRDWCISQRAQAIWQHGDTNGRPSLQRAALGGRYDPALTGAGVWVRADVNGKESPGGNREPHEGTVLLDSRIWIFLKRKEMRV